MKRKGFTLIELLAVIVILAIIALIAVPVIMNIIDKSNKKAFENSGYGIIRAGELYYSNQLLTTEGMTADKEFIFPDNYSGLELKGSKPTSGKIIVKKDGKVGMAISNGKYCVKKSYDKEEISIDEDLNNCNIPGAVVGFLPSGLTKGSPVYMNPETKSICKETEAVSITGTKTGCMKWYVYKDNGDSTYQLILDHNTTALVAWNSSDSNAEMKEVAEALTNDTSTWNKSLNVRLITADEVAEITGANREDTIKWDSKKTWVNPVTDINTQLDWFNLDGGRNTNKTSYSSSTDGWQKQYANAITKSEYAWLYDYTKNCIAYGCNKEDSSTTGYWTSTPVSSHASYVWDVFYYSSVDYSSASYVNTCGVRPVITV